MMCELCLQSGKSRADKPVAYFPKKLNNHQQAYSTIGKEALALVWASIILRYLSGGGEVIVYTDHKLSQAILTSIAKSCCSNQQVLESESGLTAIHSCGEKHGRKG